MKKSRSSRYNPAFGKKVSQPLPEKETLVEAPVITELPVEIGEGAKLEVIAEATVPVEVTMTTEVEVEAGAGAEVEAKSETVDEPLEATPKKPVGGSGRRITTRSSNGEKVTYSSKSNKKK